MKGRQTPPTLFWPAGQAVPHTPAVQVAVPPVGAAQGVHDVPQELTRVSATHAVPQRWVPAPQNDEHVPATQVLPAAHTVPHAPQWALSVAA